MTKTIESVVRDHLCHSCGACAAVCPTQAISYQETTGGYLFPKVDADRCTACGLCLHVCPGRGLGSTLTDILPSDPFVGVSQGCFIGRSNDQALYKNAQSGGVATALLCHLMEEGTIHAALVTKMEQSSPPRPVSYLATSVADLVLAQKSKYAPVATLAAMSEIGSVDGPIAVVGLPCQVHGLQNLMNLVPQLRERSTLVIGLVCDRTMTAAALDYLVGKAGLNGKAAMVQFRDKAAGGYPGSVRVVDKQGRSIVLPARERHRIKDWFTPARCRICFDKLNIFSDITVGDPWGVLEADHVHGDSIVIARTQAGLRAIETARAAGVLSLRELPYDRVIHGQQIDNKRREWNGYIMAWKALGLQVPEYYEHICEAAKSPKHSERHFIRRLHRSLTLDKHTTREALLRSVGRGMRQRAMMGVPRRLISLGVGVLRQMVQWLHI